MSLKCTETSLSGVLVIEPTVFSDERGSVLQSYRQDEYAEVGIVGPFVQDNCSQSRGGVIRGLHYQLEHPQGKLIYVAAGEIFDVVVDIRLGSGTFGQWAGVRVSAQNHRQVYVPEGFAHGFAVISESAQVIYKCTDFHCPSDEHGILWCDGDIGVDWPVEQPILSAKDRGNCKLADIPRSLLPNCPAGPRR